MKGAQPTWKRGLFGTFVDRTLGWKFGYPSETCEYEVESVRIPISEGTSRFELAADLYRPILPEGTKPAGTVLIRSPYGRAAPMNIAVGPARMLAPRGYLVLMVSSRGTFGSGGDFDPFRTETEDGAGVVEWMRKQDWYTGTFATIGPSYLGFTQWALLEDPPKDMVAAVVSVGPHDFGKVIWETGALNQDVVSWSNIVAQQEGPYAFYKILTSRRRFRPVLDSIPIVQSVEAALGDKTPWLKSYMTNSNLEDPLYTAMNHEQALERANIPILLVSGWYDLFLDQSLEQYTRLHERGCNVALTMGPYSHSGIGSPIPNQQSFEWLEKYLAKRGEIDRKAPMQYYVTGAEEWRYISKFPPPTTPYTLNLHSGKKLARDTPGSEATSSDFVFDPHTPTPTIGGNLLAEAGSLDDTALSKRHDVLTFTTNPLNEDVEFTGRPSIELYHTTDIPYADLFIRISEVDEKGKSRNITETYQRLDPKRQTDVVSLSLFNCAHRFVKGKRIRLIIAGGSHPHFARNLGVENPDNTASEMKAVKHRVFHGGARVSKVVLPLST